MARKERKAPPSLSLCGEKSDAKLQAEPCPLESGHEGDHLTWYQSGRGVYVYNARTREIKVHAQFDGKATAEDLCALLALMEIAKK